ncbi:MAG TPA: tagatose-6-phosphate ketose isomerase [Clostridiaceae bacterium]|nr:tagatose-6-phosphate ketose isomerase [Clostridiaceae bacterium]
MDRIFNISVDDLKSRNGYITASEIVRQYRLWKETLQIIKDNKEKISSYLNAKLSDKNTRIILSGAGTSAYVGDVAAPYLTRLLGRRVESVATTDIVSCPEDYLEKDTPTIMISFARSGDSPESVGAYDLADNLIDSIAQVVITCNKKGSLAKRAAENSNNLVLFMPEESNDKGFAMTSSFTCMLLSVLLMFDIENLDKYNGIVDRLSKNGERIISEEPAEILKLVKLGYSRVIYLGSSSLKGLSREAALKGLELTRGKITTSSESVMGFRHGPKSLINDTTLVFIFLSNDKYTREYDYDLLKEIYNDKGGKKVIAISSYKDEAAEKISDKLFVTDITDASGSKNVEDAFISLNFILYAQIFAFLYSMELGIEPDNPCPSGTVNRVVKGVTIHKYIK